MHKKVGSIQKNLKLWAWAMLLGDPAAACRRFRMSQNNGAQPSVCVIIGSYSTSTKRGLEILEIMETHKNEIFQIKNVENDKGLNSSGLHEIWRLAPSRLLG